MKMKASLCLVIVVIFNTVVHSSVRGKMIKLMSRDQYPVINGNWGNWTEWSACTKSCGGGVKFRYRFCDNPPPSPTGKKCRGRSSQPKKCSKRKCPYENVDECGHRHQFGNRGSIRIKDYDVNMNCEYLIKIEGPYSFMSLNITYLDLELSPGCIYDALMVFDGPSEKSDLIGTFCGDKSPVLITSSGSSLLVKFVSDDSNIRTGFTFNWKPHKYLEDILFNNTNY